MRTRTLLLLAIGCGLVILLAGGIQLWRVGGQQQSSTLLQRRRARQGGRRHRRTGVVVDAETSELVAIVQVGGIDDPDGLDGFTLVGPGKVVAVSSSTCDGITVAARDCALTFATERHAAELLAS